MRFIFLLLSTVVVCGNAFAGSYTVTLREFGFNRQTCDSDIQTAAARFGLDAGVAILSSGCLPPQIGHIASSGTFSYAAATRINTVTSDVRQFRSIDGYYTSVAACELALQAESAQFSRLTGLTPYVGYCYKGNSVSAPRYRVRIDAVGQSDVAKYSDSASWSHRAVNEAQLVAEVRTSVTNSGAEVVAALIERDISGYLVSIDFYSSEELHLHSQENLYYQATDTCLNAASSLQNQWAGVEPKSIFHCTKSTASVSRLLQIHISNDYLSGSDFDTETFATSYPSQTACLDDGSRIKDALEQSGTTVLGMTCGQDQTLQSWRMLLLSRDNY